MTEVVFDRWVSGELPRVSPLAVHCFEDAAVRTFTRAKQLGIPRVLDVASDHTGYVRLLQEEARLLRASGVAVRSAEEEKIHTDIYTERDLADYLLVPAEHVRQALQADGVPDRKIVTIPFGVDTGLFIPTATRRPPGARFTVLFVGLLNMRKGVQYLLDAWKGLGLDDAELVIVGGGDDRAIASLRATAGRNVRWVGNVPHSMVLEYYHNADVFVFPSLFESFGLVVAEAMACALPVVTTPTAGSIVRDGIDGYIVPPRDVDALKEKIATLYHDRILCRRIGQNARERVVGSYTWKHYEQRLAAFYREVVLGDTVDMVPQPEMRDRVTSGRKCEG